MDEVVVIDDSLSDDAADTVSPTAPVCVRVAGAVSRHGHPGSGVVDARSAWQSLPVADHLAANAPVLQRDVAKGSDVLARPSTLSVGVNTTDDLAGDASSLSRLSLSTRSNRCLSSCTGVVASSISLCTQGGVAALPCAMQAQRRKRTRARRDDLRRCVLAAERVAADLRDVCAQASRECADDSDVASCDAVLPAVAADDTSALPLHADGSLPDERNAATSDLTSPTTTTTTSITTPPEQVLYLFTPRTASTATFVPSSGAHVDVATTAQSSTRTRNADGSARPLDTGRVCATSPTPGAHAHVNSCDDDDNNSNDDGRLCDATCASARLLADAHAIVAAEGASNLSAVYEQLCDVRRRLVHDAHVAAHSSTTLATTQLTLLHELVSHMHACQRRKRHGAVRRPCATPHTRRHAHTCAHGGDGMDVARSVHVGSDAAHVLADLQRSRALRAELQSLVDTTSTTTTTSTTAAMMRATDAASPLCLLPCQPATRAHSADVPPPLPGVVTTATQPSAAVATATVASLSKASCRDDGHTRGRSKDDVDDDDDTNTNNITDDSSNSSNYNTAVSQLVRALMSATASAQRAQATAEQRIAQLVEEVRCVRAQYDAVVAQCAADDSVRAHLTQLLTSPSMSTAASTTVTALPHATRPQTLEQVLRRVAGFSKCDVDTAHADNEADTNKSDDNNGDDDDNNNDDGDDATATLHCAGTQRRVAFTVHDSSGVATAAPPATDVASVLVDCAALRNTADGDVDTTAQTTTWTATHTDTTAMRDVVSTQASTQPLPSATTSARGDTPPHTDTAAAEAEAHDAAETNAAAAAAMTVSSSSTTTTSTNATAAPAIATLPDDAVVVDAAVTATNAHDTRHNNNDDNTRCRNEPARDDDVHAAQLPPFLFVENGLWDDE